MIDIEKEFNAFMEFPTPDKTYVTATSAKIFASVIAGMQREIDAGIADEYWSDTFGNACAAAIRGQK
jgi:hypothetical protein